MLQQPEAKSKDSASSETEINQSVTTKIPVIEIIRIDRAYWLGIYGLSFIIILALLLAIMTQFDVARADAVSKVVSPFLTVLGTMVGVFFGVQVGSAGREEANQQAQDANNRATVFAASANPRELEKAIDAYERLSAK